MCGGIEYVAWLSGTHLEKGNNMRVLIQREETSAPIPYENAINAYTKGQMYCVLFTNSEGQRVTHKYPIASLFRVHEDYTETLRE